MPPSDLPVIGSFWYGSDLTWVETLCITSFLERGHRFVLYTAHPIRGVPKGAEIRPASDILWPPRFDISDNDRLRVAVFSDIFRLEMIQKTGFVWADLDAYCVRPFDFPTPYIFSPSERGTYPNGIMGLPGQSKTLAEMHAFLTRPNPSQPWRGDRLQRDNQRRIDKGERWGIEDLPWGCSGPKAFRHFLKATGEVDQAMPVETFYPLDPKVLWKLHAPAIATEEIERPGVHSVHIYGHQKKLIATRFGGLPRPGSYLARLCDRHGIRAQDLPVRRLEWM